MSRSTGIASVTLAAALLLGGCAAQRLSPEAAVTRYDALAADLIAALKPLVPTLVGPRGRGPEVDERDRTCTYTAGFFDTTNTTARIFEDPAWPATRAALDAVLVAADFPRLPDPERSGSGQVTRVEDRYGGRVTLWLDGSLNLYGARVRAASCDRATFGLPAEASPTPTR